MLAEWITRGAGDRDSRELLDGARQPGRQPRRERPDAAHQRSRPRPSAATSIPALEIFADIVLRPHLDDDEVEPIRALALQNLRSLEDDPGTKVIYELRRRHFPDPWGRPSPGTPEGVAGADARRPAARSTRATYRPNGAILGVAGAIDWPALRDAVGRLFGDWEPRPEPAVAERPAGPEPRPHPPRDPADPDRPGLPAATVASPDYYRARAATAILGGYSSARLFTEVREKRGLCYSVYASYEGQRDRAAVLCYAGTSADRAQETLDVTLAEIDRLGRDGRRRRGAGDDAGGPEELADHAAGVEHEPLRLARLRLVLPRPRPLARRDLRRARRPDARGGPRLRRPARTSTP